MEISSQQLDIEVQGRHSGLVIVILDVSVNVAFKALRLEEITKRVNLEREKKRSKN